MTSYDSNLQSLGPMGGTSWDASPTALQSSPEKRPLNDHNTAKWHAAHPSTPGRSSKMETFADRTCDTPQLRAVGAEPRVPRVTPEVHGIVWYINYITCLHIQMIHHLCSIFICVYLCVLFTCTRCECNGSGVQTLARSKRISERIACNFLKRNSFMSLRRSDTRCTRIL